MKKNKSLILWVLIFSIMNLTGCSKKDTGSIAKRDLLFNSGWKFIRDSATGAEAAEYNDSEWMSVDLPHDYSIMDLPGEEGADQIGPFSKNTPGNGNSTGHVIGGTGWYRKSFILDNTDRGKTIILKFDGVYMETEVWVNGKKAGVHKNGYTPFWLDITSMLNEPGNKNVIAVKVDNKGRNSRWYSGSGIYRNVHLIITQPVHVAVWGVKVTTPKVEKDFALVDVEVTSQNDNKEQVNAIVNINIKDKNGKIAASAENKILLTGGSAYSLKKQIKVQNPEIWSLDFPFLYVAEIVIKVDNKVSDIYTQTFGIRTLEFSSTKGFLLNNQKVMLKGGCLHHDNGFLGSAAFERAEVRKVNLMKANGFNAIRCAHNPPSEAFLNACDSVGMLVMNEFTDMWESYKNPNDYSQFFKEYWKADLTDMMKRDRNHPSIIMWSIGNEIPVAAIQDEIRIRSQLSDHVRSLDSTRAVTQAVTSFLIPDGWVNSEEWFRNLDVCGYNYLQPLYEPDHQKYPERIIFGSESYPIYAYDYWKAVENFPYVIGDFVWTSMDYLGEVLVGNSNYIKDGIKRPAFEMPKDIKKLFPSGIFDLMAQSPSQWPAYTAWCGDLDITGEKKPQGLYRDVLWDISKLEVNVHEPIPDGFHENVSLWGWPKEWPSWNWQGNEGKLLQVRVFTKASEVELELNGKTIGKKSLTDADKYVAIFEVPYSPGKLTAIALQNGKEVARKILTTTGIPVTVRLSADRESINADRNDLSFIKIEVVDKDGLVVTDKTIPLNITISGSGELIASGNANPVDMHSVNNSLLDSYLGKAQAIIRPFEKEGNIEISVSSEGLKTGTLTIPVK